MNGKIYLVVAPASKSKVWDNSAGEDEKWEEWFSKMKLNWVQRSQINHDCHKTWANRTNQQATSERSTNRLNTRQWRGEWYWTVTKLQNCHQTKSRNWGHSLCILVLPVEDLKSKEDKERKEENGKKVLKGLIKTSHNNQTEIRNWIVVKKKDKPVQAQQ